MISYKTISKSNESEILKIKKSKFIGYSIPVENENDVKAALKHIKELHQTAAHWCYALKIGLDTVITKANDDGEPKNSAGKPILGQIQAFDLTNVLVAVVRYYGGTKLGVGGLISAYKESARLALSNSDIIIKELTVLIELQFNYDLLNAVMRRVKQYELNICDQKMEMACQIKIEVPRRIYEDVKESFTSIYGLTYKVL